MHAVRTGIGDISEEAGWQLTLNIEVVLLDIPVLRVGIWGEGWAAVCGHESRKAGCGIAAWGQQDASHGEGTRTGATKVREARRCRRTSVPVQSRVRGQIRIGRGDEIRTGKV